MPEDMDLEGSETQILWLENGSHILSESCVILHQLCF